jgi:hypothetical protein
MTILRRSFLAAFVAASVACSPSAPSAEKGASTDDAPAAIVRALYEPYLSETAVPPAWYEAPLTDELQALIAEAAAGNEGNVPIEADPIIAGQDYQLTGLDVTVETPPVDGRAVVVARFSNMGAPTAVRYDLAETSGAWRIDNIRSEPGFDLRSELSAVIGGDDTN